MTLKAVSVNAIEFDSEFNDFAPITATSLRKALTDPKELMRRLGYRLQQSLDVSYVVNTLFEEISVVLDVQSLDYQSEQHNFSFNVGKKTHHRAIYQLTVPAEDLGSVQFSRRRKFQESELALLESLLSIFVYPLRNALQYRDAIETAFKDPLTGAANRVAMDGALPREIEVAHRYNQPLSFLMLDLDKFKGVNDNYGHSAGDLVLKETVQVIETCIRNTDMNFRFGGEEFVIVLTNTANPAAEIIAERIREAVEGLVCNFEDQQINPTVSIGLSSLQQSDDQAILFKRADQALYKAKNNGRNKVINAE